MAGKKEQSSKRGRRETKQDKFLRGEGERMRARVERGDIRQEITGGGSDARGTGSSAMGGVKASSEEGRMVSCVECGRSGGRHSKFCAKAPR